MFVLQISLHISSTRLGSTYKFTLGNLPLVTLFEVNSRLRGLNADVGLGTFGEGTAPWVK